MFYLLLNLADLCCLLGCLGTYLPLDFVFGALLARYIPDALPDE